LAIAPRFDLRFNLNKYAAEFTDMSTTQRGDEFESQIFKLVKREVPKFVKSPASCKIFSRKGYYSRDRGKDIVFDVSVEVYLPGQETYSGLVLFECKNYNHPVPVDDVEEFYSKIQQVSGANVKGIVASTNSFQEGTINFSKSKGLGLLRYYGRDRIKWELTRSPSALVSFSYAASEWQTAYKGVSTDSYQSRYFDCYCYAGGDYTNSLRAFFSRLLLLGVEGEAKRQLEKITNRVNDSRRLVEYREDSEIEEISQGILESVSYQRGEPPLNDICEALSEKSKLNLVYEAAKADEQKNGSVLGQITFDPLEIKIYLSADHTRERERFTLGHELGHLLLVHSRYMTGEYVEEADFELENPAELGVKDIMRMEWQANYFASCLLLPREQFIADFFSAADSLGLKDRGFGVLYLDQQPCNLGSFFNVTNSLKTKYKVSRDVVKLRLKKMGLLNEAADRRV
jgi:Zn-dependent peptidase ImmA (M78 family)